MSRDIVYRQDALESLPSAQPEWIPIMDGDGQMPEVDEDGYSDNILISCSNYSLPVVGEYRADEEGGAFYDGDDAEPLTHYGLMPNAWMPMIKPYREELLTGGINDS